ncbi:acyl-CoA dehydrogenase family protein [Nocardia terpenica]|uniref:Acyl-CoA dehydrogenase n=1 Tax=Nocardia terpenica TaxID=455432 RepID=A0A164NA41_9NOCA|nr:acyl-CoA dehydrogenase family protein [Nocardia terpenica]KZM74140.1 hypothetical protein AWN90_34700 [Nocardia terpenica]NQE87034.1 acyl-CoA dehydrogenase [Nocardia terpenica]
MDFGFTDEQLEFRDSVRRFAVGELECDGEEGFSHDLWRRCAKFGIQGLAVPEEYGGSAADPVTVALAMEALGYGCRHGSLPFSLGAQMWACQHPLVRFGTAQQKHRYLRALCDGTMIGAHAMSEPDSGSDAFALGTTATPEAGGWRLDGTKTFVTNADVADVFIVFARTGSGSIGGISAFLVPRDTAGLAVGPPMNKLGLHASSLAQLSLDGCRVGEDHLLGRPGAGMAIFSAAMEWERSLILAPAVGTLERQLERCLDHVRTREQFGRPIGAFQAVSHRIVGMKRRLEAARLSLYRAAWDLTAERPSGMSGALAKLAIGDALVESGLDAVHLHGGYGYLEDLEFAGQLRDAVASRIYSGTSELLSDLVARKLGI